MEVREEGKYTLLGGDFNARTFNAGKEGGRIVAEEEEKSGRKKRKHSKDQKRRKKAGGDDRGQRLFNGNMRGGENGEYTFTGGTVINYVIGDEEIKLKKK